MPPLCVSAITSLCAFNRKLHKRIMTNRSHRSVPDMENTRKYLRFLPFMDENIPIIYKMDPSVAFHHNQITSERRDMANYSHFCRLVCSNIFNI